MMTRFCCSAIPIYHVLAVHKHQVPVILKAQVVGGGQAGWGRTGAPVGDIRACVARAAEEARARCKPAAQI